MASQIMAVDGRCPLCGIAILSVGRGGKVTTGMFHPIPLYRNLSGGAGFMLCDDCGMLAELKAHSMN